jgi:hypothetical protein
LGNPYFAYGYPNPTPEHRLLPRRPSAYAPTRARGSPSTESICEGGAGLPQPPRCSPSGDAKLRMGSDSPGQHDSIKGSSGECVNFLCYTVYTLYFQFTVQCTINFGLELTLTIKVHKQFKTQKIQLHPLHFKTQKIQLHPKQQTQHSVSNDFMHDRSNNKLWCKGALSHGAPSGFSFNIVAEVHVAPRLVHPESMPAQGA